MRWRLDPSHTLVEFAVRYLAVATVKGRRRVDAAALERMQRQGAKR